LPPHVICRKGIARSFQIANVFPRLSVFRNVQVSVLSQQKLSDKLFQPAAQLVVEETHRILESVGLLDIKMDVAGSLSHGDKRILEIAIALGNEPHLLILDEPTAGMSPEETATTMALIQRLAADQGLTILFCESWSCNRDTPSFRMTRKPCGRTLKFNKLTWEMNDARG
jgi:branched-chain amino acid transport system ATP-binding protein